jgi:SAM-dependent methyltransferase
MHPTTGNRDQFLIRSEAFQSHQRSRVAHWDAVVQRFRHNPLLGSLYHRRIERIFEFLVPPGQRVLEIGCGLGDLLAALRPCEGVGIDLAPEMVRRAAKRHSELRFLRMDGHFLDLEGPFDTIVLSDLINDLWDVQTVFNQVRSLSCARTRIIINFYSHLWESPLRLGQRMGLVRPTLNQSWLTVEDVTALLGLADLEVLRHWQEVLFPLPIPVLEPLCNRVLVKLPLFRSLALTNFIIARPQPHSEQMAEQPRVSIIVPARNEAGNIPALFARTPQMGGGTELIFVEGNSCDETHATIEQEMALHPDRPCQLLRQTGIGKGDAVRLGFAHATGDILVILDADLSVPPEYLPRFVETLSSGKGEFINGVRLVYPMQEKAMYFLNLLGNKFFSVAFSWLLGQPIKDTLCGTKVLWKRDYHLIEANREYFGDFDPFGDFDLLFGAAKLGLKIVDLPIRYQDRTYGTTNIQRWRHGALLLRMAFFASRRLKFQ